MKVGVMYNSLCRRLQTSYQLSHFSIAQILFLAQEHYPYVHSSKETKKLTVVKVYMYYT